MEESTKVPHKNLLDVFMNAFLNMFDYKSRASKYDYWGFLFINTLVSVLVLFLFAVAAAVISEKIMIAVYAAYTIVSFLAGVSLIIRRLHDTGHSGLFLLAPLVLFVLSVILGENLGTPVAGAVAFMGGLSVFYILILLLIKGTAKENKYGVPVEEPKNYNMYANLFVVMVLLMNILGVFLGNTVQTLPANYNISGKSNTVVSEPENSTDSKAENAAVREETLSVSTEKPEVEEIVPVEQPYVPMHDNAE